jgi:ADP-ribose pyrophosphatase YjhB (NUDIX family)
MSDLWMQIQRTKNETLLEDLMWRRREELLAEMPVPFCCPKIAGVQAVFPRLDESIPTGWLTTVLKRDSDFDQKMGVAKYCPFCGTILPGFHLKRSPPEHIQVVDSLDYCGLCHERYDNCFCSDPLSAWEVDNAPNIFAVTALIERDGEVLSVSRKTDPNAKGLPGGKVEPNESLESAMCRELLEETGLVAIEFHRVFDALNSTGIRVVCFRVTKTEKKNESVERGIVQWVKPTVLVRMSPFGTFNWSLMQRISTLNMMPLI